MKFGVQLFGLKEHVCKQPEAVFERLAMMGVRVVEPCVYFGNSPIPNLWSERDYAQNRPLWEKAGLEAPSCHLLMAKLAQEPVVQFARQHALKQAVLGVPAFENVEEALEYAEMCGRIASRLEGTELLLHNGVASSRDKLEGKSVYEWVLAHCGENVYAQVDIGWIKAGGGDPVALLNALGSRVHSVHYQPLEETEAVACFQFARAMGVLQVIDQDRDDGAILQDIHASLKRLQGFAHRRDHTRSILCTYDIQTGEMQEHRCFEGIVEAPNWIQGEESLVYNADGLLYRYDLETDAVTPIDTGRCTNCNNDHVLSRDQRWVALSCNPTDGFASHIYIAPLQGGEPRQVTKLSPSFLHGWSPDQQELAYCAFREQQNGMQVDIYSIAASGDQPERRLTFGEGFNDGPEYAPDGQTIWFNSTRGGLMQIWRMDRDGQNPVQMTDERSNNWFAHVSPDGEKVVYLAYREGQLDPSEHLPNMHVELRLMDARGNGNRTLFRFFGGQGSINVNSWASDSRRFAFVRYEMM